MDINENRSEKQNQTGEWFSNNEELILDFGWEGGGEHLYRNPMNSGFLRKFNHMQFDVDDWKSGEESFNSFEEFWDRVTKDPNWYKLHPKFVNPNFRGKVLNSLQQINLTTLQENENRFVEEWVRVLTEGKYSTDNEFKSLCRWHQSNYRSDVLKVWFEKDVNVLMQRDGEQGLNFYDGFGIRNKVKRISYRKPFHSNMLRSEHAVYNIFVPLDQNKDLCKKVFNDLLGRNVIERITDDIIIEHAPDHKEDYLNDRTSFDAYIEYQHTDGSTGILGIEIKYTEGSYPLKEGSMEQEMMYKKFEKSKYKEITERSGKFQLNKGDFDQLKLDRYRQVWRNHLLGESILLVKNSKYHHFHSLTIYPSGNHHFTEVIKDYKEKFLKPEFQDCVRGITYEDFIMSCRKFTKDIKFEDWLEYLEKRYLG